MSTFVVGLTGGIGSGKSTVSALFVNLGINVVDADHCSRLVVEPGKPALQAIVEQFGSGILQANKHLDRAKLRSIIFQDALKKEWLETLLHPLIYDEIILQLKSATSPYVILESPLLIETNQRSICNRILVVDAEEEAQIQRTMKRDNNSEALVKSIIAAQASRAARNKAADDIIDNTLTLDSLKQQVMSLHKAYMKLSNSKK